MNRTALLLLAFVALPMLQGCRNFHVVQQHAFYRSAQMEAPELEKTIEGLGIKSIINLRGEAPGQGWYESEKEVADARGVELIDISMSADRIPTRAELVRLLDAFRDARRPILVHCDNGADRTGQAAAIYQIEYMGKSKQEAMEMLSPRYQHRELFRPAMRYFVGIYLGADWAYQVYDPCVQEYSYFDAAQACGEPRVF